MVIFFNDTKQKQQIPTLGGLGSMNVFFFRFFFCSYWLFYWESFPAIKSVKSIDKLSNSIHDTLIFDGAAGVILGQASVPRLYVDDLK